MGSGASKAHISAERQQQGNSLPNLLEAPTNNHAGQARGQSAQMNQSGTISVALVPKIKLTASKLVKAKKQEAEDARQKILWEYPELKDTLDAVQKMLQEMDRRKDDDFSRKNMSIIVRKSLEELYNLYFEQEEAEHRKIIGDEMAKNSAGYLFTEYIRVLTSDGKETPTDQNDHKAQCLDLLRMNCWNYSDSSLDLCVEFGKMGLINLLMKDLVTFKNTYEQDEGIRENVVTPVISILHNSAKATDNKKYYKETKAVEAILPYTKSSSQDLKMIAIMTLAYIVDEQDNKVISTDDSMIKYILMYLQNATTASNHKYNGFSAEELVSGLMHLASNGDNSVTIVKAGILPIMVKLMKEGSPSEKDISARTVWVLAFSNENKDKILEEEGMEEMLKKISEGPDGPSKNAASGALWVLGSGDRISALKSKSGPRKKHVHKRKQAPVQKSKSKSPRVPEVTMSMPARLDTNEESSSFASRAPPAPPPPPSSSEIPRPPPLPIGHTSSMSVAPKPDPNAASPPKREPIRSLGFSSKRPTTPTIDSEEEEEEEEKVEEEEVEDQEQEDDNSDWSEDEIQELGESLSEAKHIMISYQWDCQRLMIRMKDKLEEAGYRIWIDVESMGGSTLQAMAEAVENSDVILMSMSIKYKESPNCRTEAEYAYKLGKPIIPLLIEQSYQPDGWLGAILGAKLYHDFSNLTSFDGTIRKLMKELGDRGKSPISPGTIVPQSQTPLYSPPVIPKRIPPNQWSKSNVATWAGKHGIVSKKVLELNGAALEFLSALKLEAPEFFYKYIAEKLGVIDLMDIMKVSKGLENLSL